MNQTTNQSAQFYTPPPLSWAAKHWLLFINFFFLLYFGLPILAPILRAYQYELLAYPIYKTYSYLCHQLPSHSYFIMGYQVAMCQRCLAIYISMFVGGLLFSFDLVRQNVRPLSFKWYLLCLVPMAVDGGMQLITELTVVIPILVFWVIGVILIGLFGFILTHYRHWNWQISVFLAAGPASLLFVQLMEGYESTWWRRSLTALIFAIGTIGITYPELEADFKRKPLE